MTNKPRGLIPTDTILRIGASQQDYHSRNFTGWRSMDTAPRDGTWVELKCTYGVAPWYCLARWTNVLFLKNADGSLFEYKSNEASWRKSDGGGPSNEGFLHWRPYAGRIESYTDPTNGMQEQTAYWQGAIAKKYGLPLNYFEAKTEFSKIPIKKLPWWKVIFRRNWEAKK